MLTKEQVIRLVMLLDKSQEDNVAAHDSAIADRYINLIQCELFNTDTRNELLERVKTTRDMISFDEELRELLVEGLRSIKFREEAEKLIAEMEKEMDKIRPLPNNMGKVLLFKRG